MSSVTILVISCQKKNSGSEPPPSSLLLNLCTHTWTHRRRHAHSRLCPSPSPSFLCLPHTHAHKHTRLAWLYTAQPRVPETAWMDAERPVPAGSVPRKHATHLPTRAELPSAGAATTAASGCSRMIGSSASTPSVPTLQTRWREMVPGVFQVQAREVTVVTAVWLTPGSNSGLLESLFILLRLCLLS